MVFWIRTPSSVPLAEAGAKVRDRANSCRNSVSQYWNGCPSGRHHDGQVNVVRYIYKALMVGNTHRLDARNIAFIDLD
jgi:hypothetical protein